MYCISYLLFHIAKFIDEFVRLRLEQAESAEGAKAATIDPRLESIVMGMFERCYKYVLAIGQFEHFFDLFAY